MSILLISKLEDQSAQYFIDGNFVVETDHDNDGFYGMEKIDSALRTIAEVLQLDIEETEEGIVIPEDADIYD